MNKEFNVDSLKQLQEELNNHRVYKMLTDMEMLKVFMQHHIYSVWDFMSLLKFLQNAIAPSKSPWAPVSSKISRRLINSIVLEEESDIGLPDENGNHTYASHFEMYIDAMQEIGANTKPALKYAASVALKGFSESIDLEDIPKAGRDFMKKTFDFIETGKPHVVAAAFALGREKIIPGMFREFLAGMNITKDVAPAFHYYLDRHIHLDEDFHAPLSLQMLNEMCNGEDTKLREAEETAKYAILARIEFWNGVAVELENVKLPSCSMLE